MKLFIILAAALVSAAPAAAGVIDPVGYARDFCYLRSRGTPSQQAVDNAVRANYDGSVEAIVLPDGRDLDVALGSRGIKLLCPQYL